MYLNFILRNVADTYQVPKDNFQRCMQDFRKVSTSKHDSVQYILDFMRGHFTNVPFYRGSFVPPQSAISGVDFARRMRAKVGLEIVCVDDSTNGFWDCVSLAYFGRRGDIDLYQYFRQRLAAYVLCFWKEKPIRDILVGSHQEIVNLAQKTIDLHSYLSRLSDPSQPILVPKRPKECIEVMCTALMLGCRLSVLSLDCNDMIHCEDVGEVLSPTRVFVALNGSEFFGFSNVLALPNHSCGSHRSSVTASSPQPVQVIERQHPPQLSSSNSAQRTQNAVSTTSPQGAHDTSGWGVAPVTNSDEYLCSSWPETEALLRSLALFTGIWTDAQLLQHCNWTHRVRILVIFKKLSYSLFNYCPGGTFYERRPAYLATQEQDWNSGYLFGLQPILFATRFHQDPMGQAEATRRKCSENLQQLFE